MKNLKKNLLLIIISLGIILSLIEGSLRLIIKPFSSGAEIGILSKKFSEENYQLDENGFRNIKVNSNADFIFLGDSFTFGSGVKFEDTFFKLISDNLSQEFSFESYNLGLPNTNTINHLELIKNYKFNNKFTLVYQYFYNDIDYLNEEIISLEQINKNKNKKFLKNVFLFLANNSYTFDYLITPIVINLLTSTYEINFQINKYEEHMKDIKNIFKYANKNKGRVIFIPMPMLGNEQQFNNSQKTYIMFLKENFNEICNFDDVIIDISKKLDEKSKKLKVNYRDAHPSPYVHNIIHQTFMKVINNKEDISISKCEK